MHPVRLRCQPVHERGIENDKCKDCLLVGSSQSLTSNGRGTACVRAPPCPMITHTVTPPALDRGSQHTVRPGSTTFPQ